MGLAKSGGPYGRQAERKQNRGRLIAVVFRFQEDQPPALTQAIPPLPHPSSRCRPGLLPAPQGPPLQPPLPSRGTSRAALLQVQHLGDLGSVDGCAKTGVRSVHEAAYGTHSRCATPPRPIRTPAALKPPDLPIHSSSPTPYRTMGRQHMQRAPSRPTRQLAWEPLPHPTWSTSLSPRPEQLMTTRSPPCDSMAVVAVESASSRHDASEPFPAAVTAKPLKGGCHKCVPQEGATRLHHVFEDQSQEGATRPQDEAGQVGACTRGRILLPPPAHTHAPILVPPSPP